ncbi:hypothetical protein PsorP6_000305 [Peronosclerospora sorghi]|uniref:Uncharacterized protein n=1 Tax=Peronosclerospora sorghi TaxID=230839 RepID=A0ACC0WTN5_9STRA|nr:hypothetical protein PsorP6_000305 [Peronosclerospora sorghi]
MWRSTASSSSTATPASAMAHSLRMARQSGSLNLSSRDFHAFPDEVFRFYELLEEDEHSWECAVLRKLDLSYNDIAEIPNQVETLKYLASFKMRHNHLRQLPLAFWTLETLTHLDLSNNQLEGCLPEPIGQLVNLKELGLEGNQLTQLPDSFGKLIQLEVLRIESNQLRTLPSTIGCLHNLKTLLAHSNQIVELPLSFRSLTNLLTLDLKKNYLVTTGNAFLELVLIKYIDLRQNKLEAFPTLPKRSNCLDQLLLGFNMLREIPEYVILGVMDSLTVLDMRDNKLQCLPNKVPHLYRLKTLDVTNNDLHDLPPGLGYLKYLDHLLVEGNPLRSIRRSAISAGSEQLKKYLRTRGRPPVGVDAMEEEVDELVIRHREIMQDESMPEESPLKDEYLFRDATASGSLQLVDMKFEQLPEQLCTSGKYNFEETLLQLNLSKNWLQDLPAAIGDMRSLNTLTAEQCGLKSIHFSIARIPSLKHLSVGKNSLTTDVINALVFSENCCICSSLKVLDLSSNILTEVPQNLQYLKSIDTLDLSFNRLRSLDGFPWSKMCQLSVLRLRDNHLESCATVYQVPNLKSLSLENNELQEIPAEFALCEKLDTLCLAGNPQRGIRAHILNSGTTAVLKYLRNRLPPDTLPPSSNLAPKQFTKNVKNSSCLLQTNQNGEGEEICGVLNTPSTLETRQLHTEASSAPHESRIAKGSSYKILFSKPPSAPAFGVSVSTDSSSAEDKVLNELNAKILKLEHQLDDFTVTAAKRFALKKDLAMTRSLKLRHLRKIGQAP